MVAKTRPTKFVRAPEKFAVFPDLLQVKCRGNPEKLDDLAKTNLFLYQHASHGLVFDDHVGAGSTYHQPSLTAHEIDLTGKVPFILAVTLEPDFDVDWRTEIRRQRPLKRSGGGEDHSPNGTEAPQLVERAFKVENFSHVHLSIRESTPIPFHYLARGLGEALLGRTYRSTSPPDATRFTFRPSS